MKKLGLFLIPAAIASAVAACAPAELDDEVTDAGTQVTDGGSNPTDGGNNQTGETIDVTEDITADTTWETGNTYILKKHVFVRSGTLNIQQGVTVKGGDATSLVITREAKVNAVGTADAPIVFTSAKAPGLRGAGNWGGVVLLGKAPINVTGGETPIEGFPDGTTGNLYGGSDESHDCGRLSYVRIEFAGFQLKVDNELNSLTVAGCGSKTQLDHIQTHFGADDGIEFFGGTANLKYAVISQPNDDGIDWDYGYQGKIQFAIVQQSKEMGNTGFESDSNKNNNDATPRSMPTIYNVSLIGSGEPVGGSDIAEGQFAMHLRRGTGGKIYNVLAAYFADRVINVTDASTAGLWGNELVVKNSIFFSNAGGAWPEPKDDDGSFDEEATIGGDSTNRSVDPKLIDPKNLKAPNFKPGVESPVFTGAATPPNDDFFDTSATFVGAVGQTDWTSGWTAYPER